MIHFEYQAVGSTSRGNIPKKEKIALNFFATTLNQDDEQYDSDNTGNYPDDGCIVHVRSPFLVVKKLVKRLNHDEDRRSQGHDKN